MFIMNLIKISIKHQIKYNNYNVRCKMKKNLLKRYVQ